MSKYALTLLEQFKLQRIHKTYCVLLKSINNNPIYRPFYDKLIEQAEFFIEYCGEPKDNIKPKENVVKQTRKLSHQVTEFRLKFQTLSVDQRNVNNHLRDLQNTLLDFTHRE